MDWTAVEKWKLEEADTATEQQRCRQELQTNCIWEKTIPRTAPGTLVYINDGTSEESYRKTGRNTEKRVGYMSFCLFLFCFFLQPVPKGSLNKEV